MVGQILRKSMLYKTGVEYGDYTMNLEINRGNKMKKKKIQQFSFQSWLHHIQSITRIVDRLSNGLEKNFSQSTTNYQFLDIWIEPNEFMWSSYSARYIMSKENINIKIVTEIAVRKNASTQTVIETMRNVLLSMNEDIAIRSVDSEYMGDKDSLYCRYFFWVDIELMCG